MPLFSKAEQTPVNRRRFLAGTAAITAAACIPASAGDGIALNSISHPARAMIAADRLFVGDVVTVSPYTGFVYAMRIGPGFLTWPWPVGVVVRGSAQGEEAHLWFASDEMLTESGIIDTEMTIEEQHDAARENANGLRIHRRRLDRAAPAVLQV